jgi:hypothetical protein
VTEKQTSRRLLDRLRVPPAKWQEVFDALPKAARYDYVTALKAMAERAARMAAYFNSRDLDDDHAEGVTASNRVGTTVRRALGFTYPKQDINF